ncbi:hypothetical protein BC830DRAFT_1119286 [Chytriomyces sp. MP71]|nr:hypothetical protein BC830DRAFT_1119286 [Chytriomyces sp. MP71]
MQTSTESMGASTALGGTNHACGVDVNGNVSTNTGGGAGAAAAPSMVHQFASSHATASAGITGAGTAENSGAESMAGDVHTPVADAAVAGVYTATKTLHHHHHSIHHVPLPVPLTPILPLGYDQDKQLPTPSQALAPAALPTHDSAVLGFLLDAVRRAAPPHPAAAAPAAEPHSHAMAFQGHDMHALSALVQALSAVMPGIGAPSLAPAPTSLPPAHPPLSTPVLSLPLPPPGMQHAAVESAGAVVASQQNHETAEAPPQDATKILLRNLSVKAALLAERSQELAGEEKLVSSLKVQARAKELEALRLKATLDDLEAKCKAERAKFEEAEAVWMQKDAVWKVAIERLDFKRTEVRELERTVSDLKGDVRRETGFDPENIAALPPSSDSSSRNESSSHEVDTFLRRVVGDGDHNDDDCESIDSGIKAAHAPPSSSNLRIQIVERSRASSPPPSSNISNTARSSCDLRTVLEKRASIHSLHGDSSNNNNNNAPASSVIAGSSNTPSGTSSNNNTITIVERRPRGQSPESPLHHSTYSAYPSAPKDTLYCLDYSQNKCSSSNCPYFHGCLYCNSVNHPIATCPAQRNICVTWNMSSPSSSCPSSCRREHRCLRCASTGHKLINCPHPADQGLEYCFAFNAWGICRFHANGECSRAHYCMRCMSEDHAGFKCPMNVAEYDQRVIGPTNHSNGAEKRNGDYLDRDGGDGKRGRYDSSSSSTSVYQPRNKSPARSSGRTGSISGAGGSGIGSSSSAARIVVEERTNSSSKYISNSSSAVAPTVVRISTSGSGTANDNSTRTNSLSSVTAVGSSSQSLSLLTHTERGQVCRDYNNGKCALLDGKCRFKHVCLRCGDAGHQEKRCPHASL